MYKIVKSDGGGVCFDRPILPNAIIFGVVGVLAAFLIFFIWDDSALETWFWFASIALGLMIFGLLYLVVPDKRITLEGDGSTFVLKGKHWFGKRNSEFAADGAMTIVRVTGSGGDNAMNYILEVKTQDGLRLMIGFHGYGSFNKEKLQELGKLLQEKTRGRLALLQ